MALAAETRAPARPLSRPARRQALAGMLLAAPAVLAILVFIAYPVLDGIRLSFTNLYLLRGPEIADFVGLQNYATFLDDPKFPLYVRNTALWVVGCIASQFVLGLTLALLLNRRMRFRGAYRALAIVPWVMPPVVAGIVWRWIFNAQWGILNGLLLSLGLIAQPLNWLSDTTLVWVSVLAVALWKSVPFWYVNLLAGLQVIPRELYEAARIDGAGAWAAFWHITLPMLRPVIAVLLLLETIWRANDFAMIWVLTEGGPGDTTMTMAPLVYATSFKYYRMGLGAAEGVLLMLVMLVFAVIYLRRVRFDHE